MKELLKCKVMIGLAIFIIGVAYLNSISIKIESKMDNNTSKSELVYNK